MPEIAGQLSQMFGVRSIPFCVMFAQGQPVDGFVGAIPEAQIREFLAKHVPRPSRSRPRRKSRRPSRCSPATSRTFRRCWSAWRAAVETDPANDVAWIDYLKVLLGMARHDDARWPRPARPTRRSRRALADARFAALEHGLLAAEAVRDAAAGHCTPGRCARPSPPRRATSLPGWSWRHLFAAGAMTGRWTSCSRS